MEKEYEEDLEGDETSWTRNGDDEELGLDGPSDDLEDMRTLKK
jgi:hypothetical protein